MLSLQVMLLDVGGGSGANSHGFVCTMKQKQIKLEANG